MKGAVNNATLPRFGGAELLELRSSPPLVPGRGQIVVRVKAAGIHPIDIWRRAGYGRRMFSLLGAARLPLVLGNDFAGTVYALGRGVSTFREGDAVFGAKPPSRAGTHATHVIVDASDAVHQPIGMLEEQLASLPYNFITVMRAFAGAGITRSSVNGREVLVHGASGGLGLIALGQLRQMGAHVTAVASEHNHGMCMRAGAASVLDRRTTALRALPRRYVATLNFGSWDDEAALVGLLAPGAAGHACTVHPLLGQLDQHGFAAGLAKAWLIKRAMAALAPSGARYDWTVFRPQRDVLDHLAECAPTMRLLTPIVRFPLSQIARAHAHVEQHQAGRAVLLPQH